MGLRLNNSYFRLSNGSFRSVETSTSFLFSIGDAALGGIIGYIYQPGDPGYDPDIQHGLVIATSDQSTGIRWFNGTNVVTGATSFLIGAGLTNTDTIISVQGAVTTSYAAGLARDYNGGGYTDWFLPSINEILQLTANRALNGMPNTGNGYWSSTEFSSTEARWSTVNSVTDITLKNSTNFRIRAVRYF